MLIELSSQASEGLPEAMQELLGKAAERGLATDAVIAASLEQANSFWRLREGIVEVQKYPGGSIKHDISVPIAAVPDFIDEASAAATKLIPGARPIPFGHLGDGNVHFNVTQPEGADNDAYLDRWAEMNAVVHAVAAKFGGSISAEHGIGRLKRELLPQVKDPVALEMMRALKRTLDPNGHSQSGQGAVVGVMSRARKRKQRRLAVVFLCFFVAFARAGASASPAAASAAFPPPARSARHCHWRRGSPHR